MIFSASLTFTIYLEGKIEYSQESIPLIKMNSMFFPSCFSVALSFCGKSFPSQHFPSPFWLSCPRIYQPFAFFCSSSSQRDLNSRLIGFRTHNQTISEPMTSLPSCSYKQRGDIRLRDHYQSFSNIIKLFILLIKINNRNYNFNTLVSNTLYYYF